MNILGLNISFGSKKNVGPEALWRPLSGGGFYGTPGIAPKHLMDANKNWVYVCVDKIADTASRIPLKLMKVNADGEDEQVYDADPLKRLMGGDMDLREIIYSTFAHQELVGNAYWALKDSENKDILSVLVPTRTTVVMNAERTAILKYKYKPDPLKQKVFTYEKDVVVHFRYPDTTNPFIGKGTLEYITEWVDIDQAAVVFNFNYFKNGGRVAGVIETPATDNKSLELAAKSFNDQYSGVNNAFKHITVGKDWRYTPDTTTPKDMEFSELDNRYRDKILSAFGVPKSVVGISEIGTSRADAEAKNYVFLEFTIKPKMERFCSFLTEKYLKKFKQFENGYYFTYEDPTPENTDLKLREYQVGLGMQAYLTINEVRAREGLPAISNGDQVMGFGGFPIGEVVDKPQKTQKPRAKSTVEKGLESIARKLIEATSYKGIDDAEEIHKRFITRITTFENKYRNAYIDFNDKIREEALKELENVKSVIGQTKELPPLIDERKTIRAFINFSLPILNQMIREEGQAQIDRLDTGKPYNPNDKGIQDKLQNFLKLNGESYTQTTLKQVTQQLNQAISAGEGIADITQRINNVFDFASKTRAEATARTVTFGMANATARDAYKQSNVVKTIVWHTADDEKVCEFCGPLDGKEVAVDKDFFKNGSTLRGRNGGVLQINDFNFQDPPVHSSCRCFTNVGEIASEDEVSEEEVMLKELSELLS